MRYRISVSLSKFAVARRLTGSPQPRQVICGAGQRPLPRDLLPSALAEPPHPALLLQHSVHRFDDRFAPAIDRAAHGVPKFPWHAAMCRITGPLTQPPPSIQPTRQIRVWNIGIDLPLLQSFPIVQREESAVGTGSLQFLSALLFHQIHHRQQCLVIVGVLRHLLRHDQMILADRQRCRVTQREPAPLAEKAAVRIGSRKFLQARFAQPLQTLRNPFPLLFQPSNHFAAYFAACAFVRIVRIALLLPTADIPPDAHPRLPQRLFGVDPSREAFAAMRVESMATWPSPLARASSTTRVNKSFNPFA